MSSYNKFFFGALFFLFGVFLKSLELSFEILIIFFILFVFCFILFLTTKRGGFWLWIGVLSFFLIIGSLYYTADDLRFRNTNIVFNEEATFTGIVSKRPSAKITHQDLVLSLLHPFRGKIILRVSSFFDFEYGDKITVTGKIEKPFSDWYSNYLAKEKISGIVAFPKEKIILESRQNLSSIKHKLFNIKKYIIEVYEKNLPPKESAFLMAMTVGERGKIPPNLKEAMSFSGTSHLAALSGLHTSVILLSISGLLGIAFSRRLIFPLAVLILLGFVIMTGGSPSVMRAAIMGGLALFAVFLGRNYDFRNAIIFAALVMVLINPKLLFFDLAFRLSFAALLGIVYLRPAIMNFFKVSKSQKFKKLKGYFFITASAQFAAMPIMIANFDSFSLSAFIANVVVIPFIPISIILGFLSVLASLFLNYLGFFLGLFNLIFLKYQIGVIEFFGNLKWVVSPNWNWFFFVFYYAFFVVFIIKYFPRLKTNTNSSDYFGAETMGTLDNK